MRSIKVTFDDGDHLTTSINGTDEEIAQYYLGQPFELADESGKHHAVIVEFLDTGMVAGVFARSIESGWRGKVLAVEHHGEPMLKMMGVDWLTSVLTRCTDEEALTPDDIQWFAPADVHYYVQLTQLTKGA